MHLAVQSGNIPLVKELARIGKEKPALATINATNGDLWDVRPQKPIRYAFAMKNYAMMKTLFLSQSEHRAYINEMIKHCLTTEDEYDPSAQSQCKNYFLFSKLLEQPGVNPGATLRLCVKSQRFEYFKLLFEVNLGKNNHFTEPFTFEEAWAMAVKYPNEKIMDFLLNTKAKGFDFESKDNVWYSSVLLSIFSKYDPYKEFVELYNAGGNDVDELVADYQEQMEKLAEKAKKMKHRSDAYKSPEYLCFQLLMEKEQIAKMLKENEDERTMLFIATLIMGNKFESVEYLLKISKKQKWDIDWSKPLEAIENQNLLIYACGIGSYEICKQLIDTQMFDINFTDRNTSCAIIQCARSMANYEEDDVTECENFKLFEYLLEQPNIDLTRIDKTGRDVVTWCLVNGKTKYIDHLIAEAKRSKRVYKEQREDDRKDESKDDDLRDDSKDDSKDDNDRKVNDKDAPKYYKWAVNLDINHVNEQIELYSTSAMIINAIKADNFDRLNQILIDKYNNPKIINDALSLLDNKNMNAFHYLCQSNSSKMFPLLLDAVGDVQTLKENLNSKFLCLHIAVIKNNYDMVEEMVKAARSEKYENILNFDTVDSNGRRAIQIAMQNKRYLLIKLLFDETSNNSSFINELIGVWLSRDNNVGAQEQFLFFQRLLKSRKGIQLGEIIQHCLAKEEDKRKYFDYIIENNELFEKPLTVDSLWRCLGIVCDSTIMKAMIETKTKGFEFVCFVSFICFRFVCSC